MHKTLPTLIAAIAISLNTAIGADILPAPAKYAPANAEAVDGFDINFCGDLTSWCLISEQNSVTYKCYIYITPEIATALAGNSLTDITFSFASTNQKAVRNGSVFVSEDINGQAVTETSVSVVNSYYSEGDPWQTVTLAEPYTIKEDTGFYIGYIVKNCKNSTAIGIDYPVGVTSTVSPQFAGKVEIYNSKNALIQEADISDYVDGAMYIRATTIGDKTSVDNIFTISDMSLGHFTVPVVANCADAVATAEITNFGSNELTSITYTAQAEGGEALQGTYQISIPASSTTTSVLKLPPLSPGQGSIKIDVEAVNGVPVSASYTLPYLAIAGEGYPRKIIVEEGTGTWCGWCPRGIVAFSETEERYPDKFIGIAVHCDDAMASDTYEPLLIKFFSGYPAAVVNRDPLYNIDPSPEILLDVFEEWDTQTSPANIEIETDAVEGTKINVRAHTTFCLDMTDTDLALAFVVLEDGIVGYQSNYYAGGGNGQMGGWENYNSTQAWAYNHVARNIYYCWGLSESIPANIIEGQTYSYEYEVSLADVAKIANSSIVAILIDKNTGVILNAAKVNAADYGQAGINDIQTNTPVEYYNLQGIRMDATRLPAGIYITRQGSSTGKTIVR